MGFGREILPYSTSNRRAEQISRPSTTFAIIYSSCFASLQRPHSKLCRGLSLLVSLAHYLVQSLDHYDLPSFGHILLHVKVAPCSHSPSNPHFLDTHLPTFIL